MKQNKKGSIKNYAILFAIVISTLLVVFYILTWYKNYNDSKLSNPIIKSVLTEITFENFETVLTERDFLIVYTCTSSESKCRNFESKFKQYILENNLKEDIIYFNLGYDNKEANEYDLLNKVYNEYKHDDLIKKVNNYPTILIFSEGKIIDLLSPNKDNKVSITNVKNFLEGYELND